MSKLLENTILGDVHIVIVFFIVLFIVLCIVLVRGLTKQVAEDREKDRKIQAMLSLTTKELGHLRESKKACFYNGIAFSTLEKVEQYWVNDIRHFLKEKLIAQYGRSNFKEGEITQAIIDEVDATVDIPVTELAKEGKVLLEANRIKITSIAEQNAQVLKDKYKACLDDKNVVDREKWTKSKEDFIEDVLEPTNLDYFNWDKHKSWLSLMINQIVKNTLNADPSEKIEFDEVETDYNYENTYANGLTELDWNAKVLSDGGDQGLDTPAEKSTMKNKLDFESLDNSPMRHNKKVGKLKNALVVIGSVFVVLLIAVVITKISGWRTTTFVYTTNGNQVCISSFNNCIEAQEHFWDNPIKYDNLKITAMCHCCK